MSKNTHFTDASLDAVARYAKSLRVLNLRECEKVTGAAVMRVVQACASLSTLCVFSCPLMTANDVTELKKFVDVTLL